MSWAEVTGKATTVKFGDVVRNANLTEKDPVGAGIERIVGLEHLDPENLHIRRWGTPEDGTSFSRRFVPGQTLFGKRRAYQRKVAFAEFEGICSGDILTFESKDPKVLLPELLPFICQTDAFFEYALGTSAGSLSPRTSWSALAKFEFPLPPLEEQKRIAEILWAADEAVECWERIYQTVEDTRSKVISEFYRRGISSTAYNDVETHRGVWKYEPLGLHVAESLYGPRFSSSLYSDNANTWTIRTTDFDRAGGIFFENVPGAQLESRTISKHRLRDGDFLLSRSGEYAGLAAVFRDPNDSKAYIPAAFLIRFRLRESLLPDYLLALFYSDFHSQWIAPLASGSAQPNISASKALEVMIPIPPIEEQEGLLQKLDAFGHVTSAIANQLKSISLMSQVYSRQYWSVRNHAI